MEDGCELLRGVELDEVARLGDKVQLRAGNQLGQPVRAIHRYPAVLDIPGDENRHLEA